MKNTVTNHGDRGNKVVVTNDGQSEENVDGDEKMNDDHTPLSLFLSEKI